MTQQRTNIITNEPQNIIHLKDIYARARDGYVPRRKGLFLSDNWTKVLAKGMEKLDLKGQTLLEVGVGIGTNMAGLITSPFGVKSFIGTDICDKAVEASQKLAEDWALPNVQLIESNLLENVPDHILTQVDTLFACIPQVCKPRDFDKLAILTHDPDSASEYESHYYPPMGSIYDPCGLGLVDCLLGQARDRASQSRGVFNLAGRPGEERLNAMFSDHGCNVHILHQEMVEQHPGTTLVPFAEQEEKEGILFEFYTDKDGRKKIGAAQAEERRQNRKPIYHTVNVMLAA